MRSLVNKSSILVGVVLLLACFDILIKPSLAAYDECLGIGEVTHQQKTPLQRRAACERALERWNEAPYPEDIDDISRHQFDRLFMMTVRAGTFIDRAELSKAITAMEEFAWDPHWDFVTPSPPASDLRWLWLYTGKRDVARQHTTLNDVNTANPAMTIAVYADVLVYVDKGHLLRAEQALEIVKSAYREDPEYYFDPDLILMAEVVVELAQGDFQAALNVLENGIGVAELRSYGQRWRAIALRELGRSDAALAAALRGVETASKTEDRVSEVLANMTLALTLFKQSSRSEEQTRQIMEAVDRAAELATDLPLSDFLKAAIYDLRGRAFIAAGDAQKATEEFDRASRLAPSLLASYVKGVREGLRERVGPASPASDGQGHQDLLVCLSADLNCIPPEPRQCEYEGAGIACVPVQW